VKVCPSTSVKRRSLALAVLLAVAGKVTVAAAPMGDPASPPGFHCYECPKCAFVLIETIKEEPAPRPVGGRWTRGEMLGYSLSFALMRATKVVRGLSKGLSDDERHAVVAEVVRRLKEHGDPWKLDEPTPETPFRGHMSGHRISG
jgi:hypothetical protein